jgi:AcrR family transcriptional regulator
MATTTAEKVAAEKPKAAQRIQEAAKDLFYRQGIRATGIEEVCRAADATKMSLYRAFPSKDALVGAILTGDAETYDAWFEEVVADQPDARAKLSALVASVAAKLETPGLRGCPLLLAQAEFPDPEHPTHQLVAAQKLRMRARYVELVERAGLPDAEARADALILLIEGAWFSRPYMGGQRAAAALLAGCAALLQR